VISFLILVLLLLWLWRCTCRPILIEPPAPPAIVIHVRLVSKDFNARPLRSGQKSQENQRLSVT
jgi:hypothetical protein